MESIADLGAIILLCIALYLISHANKWLESGRWLLAGPAVLTKKYAFGIPFTIQTPERQYVVVSSEAHIKELSQAQEDRLSLVATAEEVFQPAHTMNGVELNRLGMQRRILRTFSLRLPTLQNPILELMQQALNNELKDKIYGNGWASLGIFNLAKNVIGKSNIYTFYGREFAEDFTFLEAAIQYPQDVFIAAEALRCTPAVLARLVSTIMTRGHGASKLLISRLLPMVERRIEAMRTGITQAPCDYVQHIIQLYPADVPDRALKIVQQTLALWFASVHQPATALVYALVDLCSRPECFGNLNKEIEESLESSETVDINKLPLLDSFLKESARMNASESVSLRRKALKPYTFADGTHVPLGDWTCVPQLALMRDPAVYPHGDVFDGARFTTAHSLDQKPTLTSKFTDLDTFFPFWGLGKQACPGRFYASFIIKIAVVEIIRNYDIKLKDATARRTFTWRSAIMPFPTLTFDIRPKHLESQEPTL